MSACEVHARWRDYVGPSSVAVSAKIGRWCVGGEISKFIVDLTFKLLTKIIKIKRGKKERRREETELFPSFRLVHTGLVLTSSSSSSSSFK
jgi:hypothetical protein